jgi:hypothetical protein
LTLPLKHFARRGATRILFVPIAKLERSIGWAAVVSVITCAASFTFIHSDARRAATAFAFLNGACATADSGAAESRSRRLSKSIPIGFRPTVVLRPGDYGPNLYTTILDKITFCLRTSDPAKIACLNT